MKKPLPKAKLGDVVHDLTVSRTFSVKSDDIIVDPTIQSATHKISAAATSRGFEVRVHKRILIKTGDLVFSRLHTQNGAFAFSEDIFQATGTFVPLEIRTDRADHRFLFWALHKFVPSLSASDTVGRETYKTEDILALEIPLPPLAEQRRIVARIEELAAQIHEAQSLRQQAAQEAEALLKASLSFCLKDAAKKHGLNKLGDVAKCAAGFGFPKQYQGKTEGKYPFAKVSDMNLPGNERAVITANNWVDDDDVTEMRLKIYPIGTVIFPKIGGAIATNKRRFLARPATFDNNVMGLIPTSDMLPEYLFCFMQSFDLVELQAGTSVPAISQSKVESLSISVPPLAEQRRIVAELDALQAEVDALKKLQAETAAELDALLPSILDRAFKGEL
jgi:restriction endonuclease S subunit